MTRPLFGIEVRLSPVPTGVETNRPIERFRVPETETEDDAGEENGHEAEQRFAVVGGMLQREGKREQKGGRAEADAAGERVLKVTAKQRFLEDSHQQKSQPPQSGVAQGCDAGERKAVEDECSGGPQHGTLFEAGHDRRCE